MENKKPTRSFVRRLIVPVGLAATLLGGGAWGVSHQFLSQPGGATTDVTLSAALPGAKAELKKLFAGDTDQTLPHHQQTAQPLPDTPGKTADRYALAATSVSPATLKNPFATGSTSPAATITQKKPDRYAKYQAATPTRPAAKEKTTSQSQHQAGEQQADGSHLKHALPLVAQETSADAQDVQRAPDVARGQEPGLNPLRRATSGSAKSPSDREELAASEAKLPDTTAIKEAVREAASDVPRSLQTARPLTHSPATAASDRYAATSVPATAPTASKSPHRTETIQQPERMAAPTGLGAYRQKNTGRAADRTAPRAVLAPTPPASLTPPALPRNTLASAKEQNRAIHALRNTTAVPETAKNLTPTPGLTNRPGTGRPGERLLEGLQSPAITIHKLAPAEIQVGKRCTFAIRVQNTGQRTAQNVQIHDEIPLGTELVGTAPRAAISGTQVAWELGTLSVGEERTVEMELIPTTEGELGSVATVLVAAQASAKSRCTRPELALRLSPSQPQVLVGQQQIVHIEVSNPGSGDATGVMLLESVPAGVSHAAGPALEFEIGTLAAGESRQLELILSAEQAGKINNVMTVRADANLQVQADCEFEVIAPELALSIEGPQKRYLERPATYRVSIDNPGTATAHNVELVTHLPQGLQFVSANNMGEYNSAEHAVEWSLAELPAHERGTVELVALPIEPGTQTLQVATRAHQGLEDRTEKKVLVEGLAALMFEVADLADPIEIGGETTYEIRVVNQGSKAAANVQVVAVLPAGLRALSGQGETRHTIAGERVLFAPLPSLGPKADATYRIQVQGTRPGDQRLRVQVTTDEVQQPITKEESTRVYADE